MYLLDTNIWLERLLQQPRGIEVGKLLDPVDRDFITLNSFQVENERQLPYRDVQASRLHNESH